jgi:antitoxin MazE
MHFHSAFPWLGATTVEFDRADCNRAVPDIHLDKRISAEIVMQVAKWGNSLAIRIPAAIVELLQLKEGDEVEITVADERRLEVTRKPSREELLKRLREFRGTMPPDFKFDREEANAR